MIDTQIMYYCKEKPGLQKTPCKVKTVLPTKSVRFFQDETSLLYILIMLTHCSGMLTHPIFAG